MKPHSLQFVVYSFFTFLLCSSLLAHEDTLIQLKGNELLGLPKKYTPAELSVKDYRIRIGDYAMTFSPFLKSLFDQPHTLEISASWYHERGTLPPYLSLRIQPKKKDFSYDLLLNLETLDVIELSVTLRESESTSRHLPIVLSEQQKQDILKSIQKLK